MADEIGFRRVELPGGRRHTGPPRFTIDASSAQRRPATGTERSPAPHDVVFTLSGELDTVAASAIERRGFGNLDGIGRAVVDLSEVTLIDSAGVRCIENLAAAVKAAGGRFVVRDPSRIVRRVMGVLGTAFAAVESVSRDRSLRRIGDTSVRAETQTGTARDDHCNDTPVWMVTAGDVPASPVCESRPAWFESTRRHQACRVLWTVPPFPDTTRPSGPDEIAQSGTISDAGAELSAALHGVPVPPRLGPDRWATYESVNHRIAEAVGGACGDGETVWIHDYQLLFTPAAIRTMMPAVKIGLSLHTSFDTAAMSTLSQAEALGRNLAACDLIGVQTLADADQLEAFLAGAGIAEAPPIIVSPTSIDPDHVLNAAERAATSPLLLALEQRVGTRDLITVVDDLEHIAAVGHGVAAYDLAFRLGVLDPDHVHIVEIVNLGKRQCTPEHQAMRVEIERRTHNFNATWTRSDRRPILETHFDNVGYDDTLAILRRSRVAVVTPKRAAMGTMTKEFAVLAEDTGGVLVMSDRAGAAAELGPCSVLVDCSEPSSIVDGLRTASVLDSAQRRILARRRAEVVRRWTAEDWCSQFLRRLEDVTGSTSVRSDSAVERVLHPAM